MFQFVFIYFTSVELFKLLIFMICLLIKSELLCTWNFPIVSRTIFEVYILIIVHTLTALLHCYINPVSLLNMVAATNETHHFTSSHINIWFYCEVENSHAVQSHLSQSVAYVEFCWGYILPLILSMSIGKILRCSIIITNPLSIPDPSSVS